MKFLWSCRSGNVVRVRFDPAAGYHRMHYWTKQDGRGSVCDNLHEIIVIPSRLRDIGKQAFSECMALKELQLCVVSKELEVQQSSIAILLNFSSR